jgi:SynChlorMet cassette protein ScmD
MVEPDSKPVLSPQVVLREESDEWAVLFDPSTGNAFAVDPVGVFIVKQLDGTKSIMEIVRELGELFEAVPPEADKDAIEFVDGLRQKGLASI